jgi:hypothetical protein
MYPQDPEQFHIDEESLKLNTKDEENQEDSTPISAKFSAQIDLATLSKSYKHLTTSESCKKLKQVLLEDSTITLQPNLTKFLQMALLLMIIRFGFSLLINFTIRFERPYLNDNDLKGLFAFCYFALIVVYNGFVKFGVTKNFKEKKMLVIFVISCFLQQELLCTFSYDHWWEDYRVQRRSNDYDYNSQRNHRTNVSLVFYFFFSIQALAIFLIYKATMTQNQISVVGIFLKMVKYCMIVPCLCFFTFPKGSFPDFDGFFFVMLLQVMFLLLPACGIWMRAMLKVIVKKTLKNKGEALTMKDAMEFTFLSPVWAAIQIAVDILRIVFLLIKPTCGLIKQITRAFVCIFEKIIHLVEKMSE